MSIDRLIEFASSDNILELIPKEDYLEKVLLPVLEGVQGDRESMSGWLSSYRNNMDLALMRNGAHDDLPEGSELQYHGLVEAAHRMAARAMPIIMKRNRPCSVSVVGAEREEKEARAERVSDFVNYQVLKDVKSWTEGTKRLLTSLPIAGTMFRKTEWCPVDDKLTSSVVYPDSVILDYNCASDSELQRVTHEYFLSKNTIEEYYRAGVFLKPEYNVPGHEFDKEREGNYSDLVEILESHCWLDLDGDGYEEPYIVWMLKEDPQLLRVVARYLPNSNFIKVDEDDNVKSIKALDHFTIYRFLHPVDGGMFGHGWCDILGNPVKQINRSSQDISNAGALANKFSGWVSTGVTGSGSQKIRFGEFKPLSVPGGDLSKAFYRVQYAPPDATLYSQVNGLKAEINETLGLQDLMTGGNGLSGEAATTTMARLEQALSFVSSPIENIQDALSQEFEVIFALNGAYLGRDKYTEVLDVDADPEGDFNHDDYDLFPDSSPVNDSDLMKKSRAEALLQGLSAGLPLNIEQVSREYIESLGIKNVDDYLIDPEQTGVKQQDPDDVIAAQNAQLRAKELELKQASISADIAKKQADIEKTRAETIKVLGDAEMLEEGDQVRGYPQGEL